MATSKTIPLHARVPLDLYQKLVRIAAARQEVLSVIVRDALKAYAK